MIIEDVLRAKCTEVSINAVLGLMPETLPAGFNASVKKIAEPVSMTKDGAHAIYRARLQLSLRGDFDDLQTKIDDLKALEFKGAYDSGALNVIRVPQFIFQLDIIDEEESNNDSLVYDIILNYTK